MTLFVSNTNSPLVDVTTGKIISPWNSFFQQFTELPSPIISIAVSVSPFVYTASVPGNLIIELGTIGPANIVRGTGVVNASGSRIIPLEKKDTYNLLWTVAPSIKFIPRY